MSSEEQNNQNQDNKSEPQTYYARKKNWISGVDNDTVLGAGVALATAIAGIAAYPVVKNIVDNFMTRLNQNQQPNGEQYIPPTEPAVYNGNGQPQQQQQQQLPIPPPQQQEPVEQQQPQEETNEDNEDGLFHEQELRKRQKLMGMRRARGSKYDSPFGADIGGLG